MRWRTPQPGDVREVRRFAWLPERGDDGFTYWLAWYNQREVYQDYLWDAGWARERGA